MVILAWRVTLYSSDHAGVRVLEKIYEYSRNAWTKCIKIYLMQNTTYSDSVTNLRCFEMLQGM